MNTQPSFSIPASPSISSMISDSTSVAYTQLIAYEKNRQVGAWKLPLPTALDYNSSYNWSTAELGHIATKIMSAVGAAYNSAESTYSQSAANQKGIISSSLDANKAMWDTIIDKSEGVGTMIGRDLARKALLGVSQMMSGSDAAAKEVFKQRGLSYNPNEQLYFDGVNLREFTLPFDIVAMNSSESAKYAQIVADLRQHSAPALAEDSYYFTYPSFFSVAIYIGTTLIIQRKPCAITSLNVNLAPDGNYTWRPDGKPTAYSLELSFKETTVPTKEYEKKTRLLGA